MAAITVHVASCDDCLFLWQNGEYPESRCRLANRDWGMGYHKTGDPLPGWCPLLNGPATLVLNTSV